MTNSTHARTAFCLPLGVRTAGIKLLAIAAFASALAACNDSTAAPSERISYGAAINLGQGTARSYVLLTDGVPVEIGFALSKKSMEGLPAGTAGGGAHQMMYDFALALPPEAASTSYRFLELDWNPMGHEPDGIYTVPHFDFHFYNIPIAQRDAINPADAQYAAKAGNLPTGAFAPAGYLAGNVIAGAPPELVAVPRMGMHWLDPQSEELNGKPFTKTFLYGSWDGKIIFGEPMITKAYLETKPDFSAPLSVPQRTGEAGLRGTIQRIYWNEATQEYRVALAGLAQPTQ